MSRLVCLLLGICLLAGSRVLAVDITSIALETVSCADAVPAIRIAVTGSYVETTGLGDSAQIVITDGSGTENANLAMQWGAGQSNLEIVSDVVWTVPPTVNPLSVSVIDTSEGRVVAAAVFTLGCLPVSVNPLPAIFTSGGAQLTVSENGDVFFTGVGLDGTTGFAVVTLTAQELAALPETPEENTLIATGTETTYWGEVNVYQLTTGELQVNVGPDAEGKVRVTIYDALPPTRIYGYEFNVLPTP